VKKILIILGSVACLSPAPALAACAYPNVSDQGPEAVLAAQQEYQACVNAEAQRQQDLLQQQMQEMQRQQQIINAQRQHQEMQRQQQEFQRQHEERQRQQQEFQRQQQQMQNASRNSRWPN
jgi:Skp family chaperone for outer membrane proteins